MSKTSCALGEDTTVGQSVMGIVFQSWRTIESRERAASAALWIVLRVESRLELSAAAASAVRLCWRVWVCVIRPLIVSKLTTCLGATCCPSRH